jgi:hypothetical protein
MPLRPSQKPLNSQQRYNFAGGLQLRRNIPDVISYVYSKYMLDIRLQYVQFAIASFC